ncbi:hypothetical protein HZB90_01865, partial [archaeon]|nr:hypothetical protein [archaeon]
STGAAPPAASPPEGSLTGSPRQPVYDDVVKYEEGNYKRADIKNAESDCEFAEMGRGPVKAMYTFYDKGDKEKTKLCESGHIPQAACCPFEYMYEWGWGMMFSNEAKMSYCLANPDDEEVCGIGETIQRGITGICQPESAHPRATFVVLDDIAYVDKTVYDSMYTTDVGYIVDIDESGTMRTLRRGYFSEAIIHQTQQDSLSADSIIEIAPGYGLVPAYDSQDISSSFPARDNADLSRDAEAVGTAKTALKADIQKLFDEGKVKRRTLNVANFGKVSGDDADEHWFRQIYGLIGDPSRQYLAEPAGSFIQSILTLCLSGIMTWIGSLKTILTRLQHKGWDGRHQRRLRFHIRCFARHNERSPRAL